MDKKQKLVELIQASIHEENDKGEWEDIINSSPDDLTGELLEIFSKYPNEISWFAGIYKRKKLAFAEMEKDKVKGNAILRDIFEEEKTKLENLSEITN